MKMGFILPGGTARDQLEQAILAEQAGWDGIFVWEGAYGVDAWSLLSAMAAGTSRIRLGTLLSPLPWRRPWKLASQVATVDQLSNGRAVITVGVGALTDDLPLTGEETDLRTRAEKMDEGIDLMHALWGGAMKFHGRYYHYEFTMEDQLEVVRPPNGRVPVWVVAVWPRPKSMRRVLKCDGMVPQHAGIDEIPAIRRWLSEHGARSEFDLTAEGETKGPDDGRTVVQPWADAGCTWWLETNWEMPHHSPERMREVRERIAAGPPVVSG